MTKRKNENTDLQNNKKVKQNTKITSVKVEEESDEENNDYEDLKNIKQENFEIKENDDRLKNFSFEETDIKIENKIIQNPNKIEVEKKDDNKTFYSKEIHQFKEMESLYKSSLYKLSVNSLF
jgi:hypothetical protein